LHFSSSEWLEQVRVLSGASPAIAAGETYTITTRYTPRLFDGSPHARAYDYVLGELDRLHYPDSSMEQDAWTSGIFSGFNLVLTIPGQITHTETVALTAHLDSLSPLATRDTLAPGAEDNASGSAALLEAARLLRYYQFDRSVKLIWFTGEEQGLLGSKAYVTDHSLSGYQGVVNLDMFGYDLDNDRCIELHVGTLAKSDAVGQCFMQGIAAYNLDLIFDYLTSNFTTASDHAPFWSQGVGAILVHQNGNLTTFGGCNGVRDRNPYYHTVNDTVANSFPPYTNGQPNTVGADIARAALATVAGMAGNHGTCFTEAPVVILQDVNNGDMRLTWDALPLAANYRVYRWVHTDPESLVYFGPETTWTDTSVIFGWDHHYRVEAVADDGVCISEDTEVGFTWGSLPRTYLPVVKR
jgi:leucyl aminopeptidase